MLRGTGSRTSENAKVILAHTTHSARITGPFTTSAPAATNLIPGPVPGGAARRSLGRYFVGRERQRIGGIDIQALRAAECGHLVVLD
jgi:hypothetical protein